MVANSIAISPTQKFTEMPLTLQRGEISTIVQEKLDFFASDKPQPVIGIKKNVAMSRILG